MQIKPGTNRIHVQFHFPSEEEGELILPKSNLSPSVEKKRTLVECLSIGDKVEVCKAGDFLLLHGDSMRNAVPITKEPATALIHDSMVIAIVTDDVRPKTEFKVTCNSSEA
jgi:hypothetical protein